MKTYCPHCWAEVRPDDLVSQIKGIPDGCVCDPREWFLQVITPICGSFQSLSKDEPELCAHCQHERGCHGH